MKSFFVWLDDEREAPSDGYVHLHSVNESKSFILQNQGEFNLDLDHDLGIYATDGGDAIELIKWLLNNGFNENEDYKFSFAFHTMNPVGKMNMMALVERYF